jgi:hypothetical protein
MTCPNRDIILKRLVEVLLAQSLVARSARYGLNERQHQVAVALEAGPKRPCDVGKCRIWRRVRETCICGFTSKLPQIAYLVV